MLTYYLELIQVQWDHNLEDSVIYINGVSILYHPKICVKYLDLLLLRVKFIPAMSKLVPFLL